jgi:glycerol-3-phosphate dehydrogenase
MVELVVLGGGIAGLGVAREAVGRDLTTILVEADKVAHATSNNTLRIIHGGFRYLQSFDIRRMCKSLRDQRDLFEQIPEALKVLPCIMPLQRFGLKSAVPVWCASTAYGMALRSLRSSIPAPRIVTRKILEASAPFLRGRVPHGALLWHDVLMTSPHLVASFLKEEIVKQGGDIREGIKVSEVLRVNSNWIVCLENGETISAKRIVSTLGPWIQSIREPESVPKYTGKWCKGINIRLKKLIDPNYAVGIDSPEGRLFFIVPRDNQSVIGTWYVPVDEVAASPNTTPEELHEYLTAINQCLRDTPLSLEDIEGVDVGILPMERVGSQGPILLGNEAYLLKDNYLKVVSTKYTTFRTQGENALRLLYADYSD